MEFSVDGNITFVSCGDDVTVATFATFFKLNPYLKVQKLNLY